MEHDAHSLATASTWEAMRYTMACFEQVLATDPDRHWSKRMRHTSPPGARQIRVTVEVLPPLS